MLQHLLAIKWTLVENKHWLQTSISSVAMVNAKVWPCSLDRVITQCPNGMAAWNVQTT